MSAHCTHNEGRSEAISTRHHSARWRALSGLIAVLVLLVQVSHPAIHPLEVITPSADTDVACAISHAAADFPGVLPSLSLTALVVTQVIEPLPWLGHPYLVPRLAPRPPPLSSL